MVPEVLGQLTNLTWLLGYNQVSVVPEMLGQLTNLTSLDLSGNGSASCRRCWAS